MPRINKIIKLCFIIFILSYPKLAGSVVLDEQLDIKTVSLNQEILTEEKNYARGRFIIKFKSEGTKALKESAQAIIEQKRKFRNAFVDKSGSIDQLNEKYKVKKARRLFVKDREKSPQEAKKNLEIKYERVKKKFSRRSKRITPDLKNKSLPDLSNIYVFEVSPEEDIEEIVKAYKSDSHVEYAQPDYYREALLTPYEPIVEPDPIPRIPVQILDTAPDDPFYHSYGSWGQDYYDLWGVRKIEVEKAWKQSQGENIVVAVVDTGLDYNHEDIINNVWVNSCEIFDNGLDDPCIGESQGNGYIDDHRGYDFTTCETQDGTGCLVPKLKDNDPMDGHGHGTHVSGTIAAVGDNGIGIIGVAPKVKIMPLKGLTDQGGGWDTELAEAIVYAAENGADVINNSWGCGSPCPENPIIEEAVHVAYGLGSVVVFAAGNSWSDAVSFSPQNMFETITVSASQVRDEKILWSNWGYLIDVAAPGGDILSLNAQGGNNTLAKRSPDMIVETDYLRLSGTSMAAPHVSGVVALVLSDNSKLTNKDVRQIFDVSGNKLNIADLELDINSDYRRLNAKKALKTDSRVFTRIAQPTYRHFVNSPVESIPIKGTAMGPDFHHYQLFLGNGEGKMLKTDWVPLSKARKSPAENEVLDILPVGEDYSTGSKLLKLVATDYKGDEFTETIEILFEKNVMPITENKFWKGHPHISGDWIAWINTSPDNYKRTINYFNMVTGKESSIETDPSTRIDGLTRIKVSGDRIFYTPYRDNREGLFVYDINTKEEVPIVWPANITKFDVFENRIAWAELRSHQNNAGWDIYYCEYDPQTSSCPEQRITSDPSNQTDPSISGDYIVWMDYRNSPSYPYDINVDIYAYNIATGQEQQLTSGPEVDTWPSISGNKVVYSKEGVGSHDIYVFDIETNTERNLSNTPNLQWEQFPDIYGNQVVWVDNNNSDFIDPDVALYDLIKNEKKYIVIHPSSQQRPEISDSGVVWLDYRKGNANVYYFGTDVKVVPPTVSLIIDSSPIVADSPFYLSVTGGSPEGMDSVWWFMEDVSDPSCSDIIGTSDGQPLKLGKENFYKCKGKTDCSIENIVVINEPGQYLIKANSRDVLYPVPGEAHQASDGGGLAEASITVEEFFTARIEGRISEHTAEGLLIAPLEGVQIQVNHNSQIVDTVDTDSTGNFQTKALPEGDYEVVASLGHYEILNINNQSSSQMVSVIQGQSPPLLYYQAYRDYQAIGIVKKWDNYYSEVPFEGVSVEVFNKANGTLVASFTSDNEGKIYVSNLSDGIYDLIPKKDHYEFQSIKDWVYTDPIVTITIDSQSPINEPIQWIGQQNEFPLEGKIEKSGGMFSNIPFEGVSVDVIDQENGQLIETVVTDVQGQFVTSHLPYGTYALKPMKEHYAFESYWASNSPDPTVIITISEDSHSFGQIPWYGYQNEFPLSGLVEKQENYMNVPFPGVNIEVVDQNNGQLIETVVTDAQGQFETSHLPYGTYALKPVKEHYAFESHRASNPSDPTVAITIDPYFFINDSIPWIGYQNAFQVEGIVQNRDSYPYVPFEGVEIKVVDQSTGQFIETFVTDINGSFLTSYLPEGVYEITASLDGYTFENYWNYLGPSAIVYIDRYFNLIEPIRWYGSMSNTIP